MGGYSLATHQSLPQENLARLGAYTSMQIVPALMFTWCISNFGSPCKNKKELALRLGAIVGSYSVIQGIAGAAGYVLGCMVR
ncbi:MAG: hypothetical protein AABX11_07400 [Nanoarchaeota archaeon]